MDDTNPDPELAALEARIVEKANQSGIGPMGFGGKTTLLACKIGKLNRLPASFFVSIAYMCWAFRRRGANLDLTAGTCTEWLVLMADSSRLTTPSTKQRSARCTSATRSPSPAASTPAATPSIIASMKA